MADDMGERTEAPTERKLREARDRGQMAKSQDLSSAVVLLAGAIMIALMAGWLAKGFAYALRTGLSGETLDAPLTIASAGPALRNAFAQIGMLLWPVLAMAFIIAAVSQFMQVGPLVTFQPVKPKLSNLSPAKGIKKIFGMRGIVMSAMNSVKLVMMVTVSMLVIRARIDSLAALPRIPAAAGMALIGKLVLELALWLLTLLILIAAIDYIYQRWQHKRDLRMTKQEVKDERRTMEGDPLIKGQRMRMYQQMISQQIGQAVPDADVIINNPTHFSVAVRYDPQTMSAPTITAKGADYLALRIRHTAALNKVPMVTRPPLARALYWGADVGQTIAPEHYQAVAEILAYVYRIDAMRADRMERERETAGLAS